MGLTSPLADLAKTDDVVALADLSEQIRQLNDTMLYFVSAMLDKMPRLDAQDRVITTFETPLPSVTQVNNINSFNGGNANFIPYQLSNVGALHLYDNVKVS